MWFKYIWTQWGKMFSRNVMSPFSMSRIDEMLRVTKDNFKELKG